MKKLLNTLYVTTQGTYLSKERESVAVTVAGDTKLRLPIHNLAGIVCFGNVSMSPFLMGHCAEKNVSVSFLTKNGRFLARIHGPVSGNVLLRRAQYRLADSHLAATNIARSCLIGKTFNCRSVLSRFIRDHGGKSSEAEVVSAICSRLKQAVKRLKENESVNSLRGTEGDIGRYYFSVFDNLIVTRKKQFKFTGRVRRPPTDRINALLSFVYTLLAHDTVSALESVGLDPVVGFLHQDRPGRSSLALDLMEELRPFIADRLVLSLINLKKVSANGFMATESGAVRMNDQTRKTVLSTYQERKQEQITHPFINEKIQVGLVPFVQSMLLARHIRGDLEVYPPFIWR